jgi:multidrug resistance efflux pump
VAWTTSRPVGPTSTGPPDLAARHSAAHPIYAIGYVEPTTELRRLAFRADGVIAECRVEIGQQVREGDLLLRLHNADRAAECEAARLAVALAQAEHDQVVSGINRHRIEAAEQHLAYERERLSLAQKRLERATELLERRAKSREDFDQIESDLRQAEARVHEAEAELAHLNGFVRDVDRQVTAAKLHLAEARFAEAQERLRNTELLAPTVGVVLEILRRPGESGRIEGSDAVILFADTSQRRVRAEVDERFVGRLAVGQAVTVYGRGLGEKQYQGRLALVKPVMGKKTIFTHDAAERKDLDILQVLVDLPPGFVAPLGLEVDVAIDTRAGDPAAELR